MLPGTVHGMGAGGRASKAHQVWTRLLGQSPAPPGPPPPHHPSEVAGFVSLGVFLCSWARSPHSSSRRALPSVHTLVAELIRARSRTHVAERAPRGPPGAPTARICPVTDFPRTTSPRVVPAPTSGPSWTPHPLPLPAVTPVLLPVSESVARRSWTRGQVHAVRRRARHPHAKTQPRGSRRHGQTLSFPSGTLQRPDEQSAR